MKSPPGEVLTAYVRRRRQAIVVLGWFSVVFFGVWIGLHLGIGLARGHSLVSGTVTPLEPGSQGGNGFFGDLAVFAVTTACLAGIVAGWNWLASRLGSEPDPSLTQAEIDVEPLYDIEIPRLNKAIVITAIVCLVGSAVFGALPLPMILLKFGW